MNRRKHSAGVLGLRMIKSKSGTRQLRQFSQLLKRPPELDLKGLGRTVCEVLGVRSGDTVELHILTDGSVRIINNGTKKLLASRW